MDNVGVCLLYVRVILLNRHESKRDRCPESALRVEDIWNLVVTGAYVLPAVSKVRRGHLLEEMKITAVLRMISYRAVTADEAHRSGLALAEVNECAVCEIFVVVAVAKARLAGNQDDDRCRDRRDDPALLLPAELVVQLTAAVDLAKLEQAEEFTAAVGRCPLDASKTLVDRRIKLRATL